MIRGQQRADLRWVADGCRDFAALTQSSKQSQKEFVKKKA
jgi:hypothetical protein